MKQNNSKKQYYFDIDKTRKKLREKEKIERDKISNRYMRRLLKERKLNNLIHYQEFIEFFKVLLMIKRQIRQLRGI